MGRSVRTITVDPDSAGAKIMFIIGLLLIALSVYLFVQKKQKLDRLPTTEAVILETEQRGKRSGDATYTLIEYEVDGQTYTHRFNSYSFFQDKGAHMTVAYDRDDPTEVYETGFRGHLYSFLAAIFGLAFMTPIRPFRWFKGS